MWVGLASNMRKLINEGVRKVVVAAHPQARANAKDARAVAKVVSQTCQFLQKATEWGWFEAAR